MGKLRGFDILRTDIDRGFIKAYYELVRGCHVVLDNQAGGITKTSLVALAYKPGILYGMDFSSEYHFDGESKPSTKLRRVKRKIEELQYFASILPMIVEEEGREYPITYEIWCFLPPNRMVADTVAAAQAENLPVDLVTVDRLHKRLRQTPTIQPMMTHEQLQRNAFLWAAKLYRDAGAWR